ncbi:NUDIX domain-containing protein [Ferrimonas lipolytica]|nr:NUDIX domain-containing protein [Ferrimonas lipolytica]
MASFTQQFSSADVNVEQVDTAFNGFFRLDKITFRHALFAGGMSDITTREVFERGDAVVVLAYDADIDTVVLVEQLRIPALRTAANPWQLELVAGIVEPGESKAAVARRELLEESGLVANSLTKLCSYMPSPGGCSERHTLYLANVTISDQQQLFGVAAEQEDIRRHLFSRTEALAMVEQGVIDNAPTIIGLQWLALHHSSL